MTDCARWLTLAMICTAKLSITGCGDNTNDLSSVPDIRIENQVSLAFGTGMISPYRALRTGIAGDPLYVLTGRGETFPEGFLHALDLTTLQDVAAPLEVGGNGADLVALPAHIIIASRGLPMLQAVDKQSWTIVDRLVLDFTPVSMTILSENMVAVASGTSGVVTSVEIVDGRLRRVNTVQLGSFASAVLADSSRLYVVQPLRGVEILDASNISKRVASVALPGEPSRGALFWQSYLVVSNRDGYLHFIDLDILETSTIDVAPLLALDRATLPARGIDSGGLIELNDVQFVLVNGRQDSIVFELDRSLSPPVRVVATIPGGAYGVYLPENYSVYVTQPSLNAIVVVDVSRLTGTRLKGDQRITGSEIVAVQTLDTDNPALAVLNSEGRLVIVDDRGILETEVQPGPFESWRAPLTTGPDGGLVVVAKSFSSGNELVYMDRGGAVISRCPIEVEPVFSAVESNGTVLLISRLNQSVQIIHLGTCASNVLRLERDRPRQAASLGDAMWAIIHDTNPDIGISLLAGGRVTGFEQFDDWYSDIVAIESGRAIAASFYGTVTSVNVSGKATRRVRTGIASISDIELGFDKSVWLTAENQSTAYHLVDATALIDFRHREPGLKSITAWVGADLLVATTLRHVNLIRLSP